MKNSDCKSSSPTPSATCENNFQLNKLNEGRGSQNVVEHVTADFLLFWNLLEYANIIWSNKGLWNVAGSPCPSLNDLPACIAKIFLHVYINQSMNDCHADVAKNNRSITAPNLHLSLTLRKRFRVEFFADSPCFDIDFPTPDDSLIHQNVLRLKKLPRRQISLRDFEGGRRTTH